MNTVLIVLDAVINTLWQAALIAAAVWIVLRFAPRINAATRHAIWWAALAVILVLPAAPGLISRLKSHAEPSPTTLAARSPAPVAVIPDETVFLRVTPQPQAWWPRILLAVWALILLWRAGQIVRSYFYLRGVKHRATASSLALPPIQRRAAVIVSNDVASPMAVGFLHPAIILPGSMLDKLSPQNLEHVLLHESAHIAGYDDWANLLMRALGGALALHPVAVWILRQIEREREIACDDWVVAKTGAARPYAESLAHLMELRQAARGPVLASGFFGSGSRIGDRIEALLRNERGLSIRASGQSIALGTVTLIVLLMASSLTPRWIAFAQNAALHFAVASIKADNSGGPLNVLYRPGGRFTAESMTLRMLIENAYDVRSHQVSGGPSWIASDRFSIDARAAGDKPMNPPIPHMREMVQALLAERFHLHVRKEIRNEPIYELTLDKGGSKLKPDTTVSHTGGIHEGRSEVKGMSASLEDLTFVLSKRLGRSVVDKTGLSGPFDFDMKWESDADSQRETSPDNIPPDAGDLAIFDALRSQLGLKLVASNGPVEVLVIEHAEKPDAN